MSLFTGAAIIGAALAAGTAGVVAAKVTSGAAGDAAEKASASNAEALKFQREQAEADYKNQETTRRANYDQHVATMTANNRVRQALGLAPVPVPAYVPSIDPGFVPVTGQTGGPGGPTVPPIPPPQTLRTMAQSPNSPPSAPPFLDPNRMAQLAPAAGPPPPQGTLAAMAGSPVDDFADWKRRQGFLA